MICVSCPVGCMLNVRRGDDSSLDNLTVTGNQCSAGLTYAEKEMTNPTRNIATSLRVTGGDMPMLSVKTAHPIPKRAIMDVVKAVHKISVHAPVELGDVVLADAAGTGVDIVATRNVRLVIRK